MTGAGTAGTLSVGWYARKEQYVLTTFRVPKVRGAPIGILPGLLDIRIGA